MDCAAYNPMGDQPTWEAATVGQRYSDLHGRVWRYVKYTEAVAQGDALIIAAAAPWEVKRTGAVTDKVWGFAGAARQANEYGYMQIGGRNAMTITGSAAIAAGDYLGGSATAGRVTAIVVGTTTAIPCGQAIAASAPTVHTLAPDTVLLAFNM